MYNAPTRFRNFFLTRLVFDILCSGVLVLEDCFRTINVNKTYRLVSDFSASRIIKTSLSLIATTHFTDLHISTVKRRTNVTIYRRLSSATQSLTMFNTRIRNGQLGTDITRNIIKSILPLFTLKSFDNPALGGWCFLEPRTDRLVSSGVSVFKYSFCTRTVYIGYYLSSTCLNTHSICTILVYRNLSCYDGPVWTLTRFGHGNRAARTISKPSTRVTV